MLRNLVKKKKGFTLVEVMVVVLILGLLTAVGIPTYRGASAYVERRIIESNLRMIDNAVEVYYTTNTDPLWPDAPHNPQSPLIPDYLKAPIRGPKSAQYWLVDFTNVGVRAAVTSTKNETIGGSSLYSVYYHINMLPWND